MADCRLYKSEAASALSALRLSSLHVVLSVIPAAPMGLPELKPAIPSRMSFAKGSSGSQD
eukprot:9245084-Prorocentrum_lima.AAC.1